MAAPTDYSTTNFTDNHTRQGTFVDLCEADDSSSSKLDLKSLENRGYCHYKVCENRYGCRNGRTRNPDVIYSIICEETTDCTQVYLTVDVMFYDNGVPKAPKKETVPAGCVYSVSDLRDSITVEDMEPRYVI